MHIPNSCTYYICTYQNRMYILHMYIPNSCTYYKCTYQTLMYTLHMYIPNPYVHITYVHTKLVCTYYIGTYQTPHPQPLRFKSCDRPLFDSINTERAPHSVYFLLFIFLNKKTHTHTYILHPQRRPDLFKYSDLQIRRFLKYSDLQIRQFSCPLFRVTGTPVYSRENLFENLGNPVKTCSKVTGTQWKIDQIFGSCNYFESDLLRAWFDITYVICVHFKVHTLDPDSDPETICKRPLFDSINTQRLFPLHILLQCYICTHQTPHPQPSHLKTCDRPLIDSINTERLFPTAYIIIVLHMYTSNSTASTLTLKNM